MHTMIGLLSDAHGNGPAFDRAVAILINQGAERLFFLGDAIGYVPSTAVLDSLDRLGDMVQCIRGNHEAMLLKGPVGFARDEVYQLEQVRSILTQGQLEMISSWPEQQRVQAADIEIMLVHGSPNDASYGYVYPDTDLSAFAPKADFVFMGNTHRPFIREFAGTCYVNIGSCGLPRDDGRFGAAALLDTRTRKARILRFDITADSKQLLEQFPTVHPSVRNVYARRQPLVIGDIF